MYSLKYSHHAKRALRNIDPLVGVRIYRALETIREDPRKHVMEMKRSRKEEPLFKFRVGDYRIIMSLFDDDMVILVVDIGMRKTIYKKYGGKG
jgi:mRNA interferase RelE/StbE